jgi:alkylated DNA nucleotide flippase Atl1
MDTKQKILEALLEIPKWKVTTYKNLAYSFSVHPRKVSQIMRYNKFPDKYPCYKVIASDGGVSWYSWKNWVSSKISMLENDWVKVVDWKIDKSFII